MNDLYFNIHLGGSSSCPPTTIHSIFPTLTTPLLFPLSSFLLLPLSSFLLPPSSSFLLPPFLHFFITSVDLEAHTVFGGTKVVLHTQAPKAGEEKGGQGGLPRPPDGGALGLVHSTGFGTYFIY